MSAEGRRGSILLAVLLLAALLAVFIGVAVDRLRVARESGRAVREDIVAEIVARATIERLFARTGGRFGEIGHVAVFEYPGALVEVSARDEAARIDLNAAPIDLLAGLFQAVGFGPSEAAEFAGRIEARRRAVGDPTRRRPDGSQERRTFQHVLELAEIKGLPPQAIARIAPFVTVAGFGGRVAILSAEPTVVAAVPGFDRGRLAAFLAERTAARPFGELVRRYGFHEDRVTRSGGIATRLAMRVSVGPHRTRRLEVVVTRLEEDDEPYRIVSWEDASGEAAEPRSPR